MRQPRKLEDLIVILRARGERVTTARRAVLAELLASGDEHPTAELIAQRLSVSQPEVHTSTVYRTLDALDRAGMVIQAGFENGAATYHLADAEHHHARCDTCGERIDLPESTFAPITAALRREHGFDAHPRHLTISGTCATCSAARE